jgi:HD-GYP domain-containing protein (c-di-GMP phosphodiesterase class II)
MRTIKTSDLRDGMKFDKPVYVDGENVFVPPGIPIRQKDIDRLVRWEIPEVHTDGSPTKDDAPKLAKTLEPIDTSVFKDLSGDRKSLEVYLKAIEEYERVMEEIEQAREPDRTRIDAIVNQLLERIKESRNEMIQLILMGGKTERKISASVVNVTILSTIIGMVLRFTSHRLIQLTTAAYLHDIGMRKSSREILSKKEKLSPEELNQIRTHPIHSYRTIAKDLKYPDEIGIIALQHHERWDGQGYPRKLRGEDINIASRVLAVADAYIAMINERPYRNSIIGYSAMKTVLSDNGRHFDPKILKAFLESMGIYPIGSVVQLNNSSIGRVIEIHTEAPLRPVIELIVDEYSNAIREKETLDLLAKKNLFIVKAVDPKTVAQGSGRAGT